MAIDLCIYENVDAATKLNNCACARCCHWNNYTSTIGSEYWHLAKGTVGLGAEGCLAILLKWPDRVTGVEGFADIRRVQIQWEVSGSKQ